MAEVVGSWAIGIAIFVALACIIMWTGDNDDEDHYV